MKKATQLPSIVCVQAVKIQNTVCECLYNSKSFGCNQLMIRQIFHFCQLTNYASYLCCVTFSPSISLFHSLPFFFCRTQTLLVLSSLSAIALILSLLVILSFLIHYCCCHRGDASRDEEEEDDDASGGHGYGGRKGRRICCVTWVSVAAVTLCW